MKKQAFDEVANSYDDIFSHSAVGKLQINRVYHFLKKLLDQKKKLSILELNCGTGRDAIWLAQQGHNVLATDISTGMVDTAIDRVEEENLSGSISVQQCSIQHISQIEGKQKFDLVFSNFGGLNCLDEYNLRSSASAIDFLLKPGGHFVAVIMGTFCFWESFYFLAKLAPKKAFRRWNKEGIEASLGNGQSIKTWYYSPKQFYSFYKDYFKFTEVQPIGIGIPPSYLDQAFINKKRILKVLLSFEKMMENKPLAARSSDHYLLCMTKQSD